MANEDGTDGGTEQQNQQQEVPNRPLRTFDEVVWNNEPASTTEDRQPELSPGAKAYDEARAKLGDPTRRLHSFDDLIWKK